MKVKHVFGVVLANALMVSTAVSAAAASPDDSACGYLTGKEGRPTEATSYAGMDHEGGEQGDTSVYSYLAGKEGRLTEAGKATGGGDLQPESDGPAAFLRLPQGQGLCGADPHKCELKRITPIKQLYETLHFGCSASGYVVTEISCIPYLQGQ